MYPSRFDFVKSSLPWKNHADRSLLTGIPIHCSLLYRLMEVHEKQKALSDQMMSLIVKEFDERNMGNGHITYYTINSTINHRS